MAAPIAQDDDIIASRTSVRVFDVFADNGNGVDSDPDGDRISVSRVENKISWVDRSFTLESGARARIERDGTFIFNPNDAYDDLDSGESVTETIAYTIRDPGGSVDHAEVEVTVEGPRVSTSAEGIYFTGENGEAAGLWHHAADGTIEPVVNPETGAQFPNVFESVTFGEAFYFTSGGSDVGSRALWSIQADGTVAKVADAGSGVGYLVEHGDSVLFTASDAEAGEELWRLDASGAASRVADINPGPADAGVFAASPQFVSTADYAYVTAETGDGRELFRVDGDGDLENVQDLLPEGSTPVLHRNGEDGDSIFVQANDTGRFIRLDDSGRTTTFETGSHAPDPEAPIAGIYDAWGVSNALFLREAPDDVRRPYITKYAPNESQAPIFGNPTGSASWDDPIRNGEYLYYADTDGELQRLRADREVQPIGQGFDFEDDVYMDGQKIGSDILFSRSTASTGQELFKVASNGEVSLLADVNSGPADSVPDSFQAVPFAGDLYFRAEPPGDSDFDYELWRVDSDGQIDRLTEFVGDGSEGVTGVYAFDIEDSNARSTDEALLA